MHAILREQDASVKCLLELGADPDIPNFIKETPLHVAADNGLLTIVQVLLQYQADPDIQNSVGETPLHLAVLRGNAEIAEALLGAGAHPNEIDRHMQRSPLHYAASLGYVECCRTLLRHGADVTLRDSAGQIAEEIATADVARVVSLGVEILEEAVDDTISEFHEDHLHHLPKKSSISSLSRVSSFLKLEEANEPDSEQPIFKAIGRSHLWSFLSEFKLEQYHSCLVKAGFDDLAAMIRQMQTPMPIDVVSLQSIGINKIGHAKRLLMKLETPEPLSFRFPNQSCCAPNEVSFVDCEHSLEDWLATLQLQDLHQAFCEAGYDDLALLRDHMQSRYPLTDEVLLSEVRVIRPGHRMRILGKLQAEASRIRIPSEESCQSCRLF